MGKEEEDEKVRPHSFLKLPPHSLKTGEREKKSIKYVLHSEHRVGVKRGQCRNIASWQGHLSTSWLTAHNLKSVLY